MADQHPILALLVSRRHELGLSQQDLAETLGTQQSAISECETGVAGVTLATLTRWAYALSLDLALVLKPQPSFTSPLPPQPPSTSPLQVHSPPMAVSVPEVSESIDELWARAYRAAWEGHAAQGAEVAHG